MKGKVIAGKVAVRLLEGESKTQGGIYIPENAKKNEVKGEVVAVGASLKDEPIEVSVGDIVLISIHSGIKFEESGEKYKRVNHDEILWIYEK